MIRFKRVTLRSLNSWLVNQPVNQSHARYELRAWREVNANLAPLRDELIEYVQEALEDARARLRKGFDDNLSPFADPVDDPAAHYPAMLSLAQELELAQDDLESKRLIFGEHLMKVAVYARTPVRTAVQK